MQLKKLLEKWDLTSLQIKTPFLEMEWQPRDEDKTTAWELLAAPVWRIEEDRGRRVGPTEWAVVSGPACHRHAPARQ